MRKYFSEVAVTCLNAFFFFHDGHKKFGDHFQKGWRQKQTLALSKQKAKPISLNHSLTVTAKTKSPFTSMSKQYLVSTIKRKEKETYLCSLRQTSTIQRQHESSPWTKLNSFQMITELLFSTKQWTQSQLFSRKNLQLQFGQVPLQRWRLPEALTDSAESLKDNTGT